MTTIREAPVLTAAPSVERDWRSWVIFPALLLMLFLGLVAADLNGSSVGALRTAPGVDRNLLLGEPRGVRSDELNLTTPIAVSAARQGFPDQPYVGLTPTQQQAVPHGGPTHSWLEVFKPQDWGYLALGAHRGLAAHWWFPFLVSLVGVFWLLRSLRVGAVLAAALAVVATMTPYDAWWSAPPPSLFQGFAALTGAAAIAGLRSTGRWTPLAWGLAAGVAATALFLALYPPWLVSLALVVAALVAGYAVDTRPGLRRPLLVVAGMGAVAIPTLAAWYVTNRDAITATTGTFYPGHRLSVSGEATFSWLLSAPFNPLLAGTVGGTLDPRKSGNPYTNLSEISASWLPLPVVAAALVILLVRRARRSSPPAEADGPSGTDPSGTDPSGTDPSGAGRSGPGTWTVVGVTLSLALLLAWAVLALPEWTGTLLLERVKGTRVPLALGLACVLVVAIAGSRPRRRPPVWETALYAVAVVATVALSLWAAARMPWDDGLVSDKAVVAFSVVVALGFGLVAAGRWPRTTAVLLAVFATWSWALVNPLYHGLGPLDSDPLARVLRPIGDDRPGDRVMVFGDPRMIAIVRGSGLQSLSGTTLYPNVELMQRLAPTQRNLWNNYATYVWRADTSATGMRIRQIRGTSMELTLNPCEPAITALGAAWAVSDKPLTADCLTPRDVVQSGAQTRYLYAVTPATP